MNLAGFIDTYKDAIAQRVVESYPPSLSALRCNGSIPMPKLLAQSRWARRRTPFAGRRSPSAQNQGTIGGRRDGNGQDLHRDGRRARCRL